MISASRLALVLALSLPAAAAGAAPREATDLDAGEHHSCFVDTCGDVHCFGRDDYGQSQSPAQRQPPFSLSRIPWTKVTTGRFHSCALAEDQRITCWGRPDGGRTSVPAARGPFLDVDAGASFTCAVNTAHEPVCWGSGSAAQPPSGLQVVAIDAGISHACAVTTAGAIRCWGSDPGGAAYGGQEVIPDYVEERFVSVSAGAYHTCALSNGGRGYCWGSDVYGAVTRDGYFYDQDGDGIYVYNPRRFTQIAAGVWGTCGRYHVGANGAYTGDDETWCWGWPFYQGSAYDPPAYDPRQLAVGASHACAIDPAGIVDCWGSDAYGKATPPTLSGTCALYPFIPGQPIPISWP